MEILNEWVRLVTGKRTLIKDTDGLVDVLTLPKEVQEAIETLTFGMSILSPQDLEHIDAQWNSLDDLRYLHRLYMTTYQNSEYKIKPIVDTWNPVKELMYICENRDNRIYLKYLMIPQDKVGNNIYLETLNRNFETYLSEIENLPILMGLREGTSPSKPSLLIMNVDNLTRSQYKRGVTGTYIGDCMIFKEEILISIGSKITYWSKVNKTKSFSKSNVKALSELLCKEGIQNSHTKSYKTFIENIK